MSETMTYVTVELPSGATMPYAVSAKDGAIEISSGALTVWDYALRRQFGEHNCLIAAFSPGAWRHVSTTWQSVPETQTETTD